MDVKSISSMQTNGNSSRSSSLEDSSESIDVFESTFSLRSPPHRQNLLPLISAVSSANSSSATSANTSTPSSQQPAPLPMSAPTAIPLRPNRVSGAIRPVDYSQQEPSTINQSQTLPGGGQTGTATTTATSLLSLAATNSGGSANNNNNQLSSTPPSNPAVPGTSSASGVISRRPRPRHDSESESRMVSTSSHKTVYTAGRPPWYDWLNANGNGDVGGVGASGDKKPFVIGVCGGSASGKTTVATSIVDVLDVQWVSLVSMDSFYRVLDKEQHDAALRSDYNFDHPSAFDIELLVDTLTRLKAWKSVEVPIYNFTTHSREKNTRTIYGANVVIVEGIMAFCDQSLLDVMDLKIFVDTDSDIRLARRLTRDILERGRDIDGVLKQYNKFVKPAYENYIEPTRCKADIVVPRGGENSAAVKLIAQHVHNQLQARGNTGFRSKAGSLGHTNGHHTAAPPQTLYVLESTSQVKGMHTIIRNQDTSRDDFTFYSKRLMRLLVEYAASLLPYRQVTVQTPQGVAYCGQRLDLIHTCAVSILRAGETLEPALRSVMKDISIGKILIQTNSSTGEPELHYHRLPHNIASCHVLLLDATVSTGSAAIMAIRVLLDHDVLEENIILVSLLMAQLGAQNVAYCFPRVKIVTTAVDALLDDKFYILPGLGNFGDRFFGTD